MDADSPLILVAELEDAFVYVWLFQQRWSGMVIFRNTRNILPFQAQDENAAKSEGLKIAGHPDANWRSSSVFMGF
jgi:hypothetical protein